MDNLTEQRLKLCVPALVCQLSSPEMIKEAVKLNKSLLGYIGVRKNPEPDALAFEIVQKVWLPL